MADPSEPHEPHDEPKHDKPPDDDEQKTERAKALLKAAKIDDDFDREAAIKALAKKYGATLGMTRKKVNAMRKVWLADKAKLKVVGGTAHGAQAAAAAPEEDPGELETEVGVAYANAYTDRMRYDYTRRKWLIWNGKRWRHDEVEEAERRMHVYCEAARLNDPEVRAIMGTVRFAENALRVARRQEGLRVQTPDLDRDPMLLGTPSGYVDLNAGELQEPDPGKMITRCTLRDPAPEGTPCPVWMKFLYEATGGDAELIGYLQKFFGYCLTGSMEEEIFTFLHGLGGNGKGVMVGAIAAVMGTYAVTTTSGAFTKGHKFDDKNHDFADLAGARLVTASEVDDAATWNTERIKLWTGNEGKVKARFLYKDFFDFEPMGKLLIVGNSKPDIAVVDPAIVRRLRLIPFDFKPTVPDLKLKARLRSEYPAILRWTIDGCLRWIDEGGLKPIPKAVEQASNDYQKNADLEGLFIDQWLEFGAPFILLARDLKRAIECFWSVNGCGRKLRRNTILDRLTGSKTRDVGGTTYYNQRGLAGVRLNDTAWRFLAKHARAQGWEMPESDLKTGLSDEVRMYGEEPKEVHP